MALSRVVSEILNVEKYCDLEMWVRGHSRSLKVVPFESLVRFPNFSYLTLILTLTLTVTLTLGLGVKIIENGAVR